MKVNHLWKKKKKVREIDFVWNPLWCEVREQAGAKM